MTVKSRGGHDWIFWWLLVTTGCQNFGPRVVKNLFPDFSQVRRIYNRLMTSKWFFRTRPKNIQVMYVKFYTEMIIMSVFVRSDALEKMLIWDWFSRVKIFYSSSVLTENFLGFSERKNRVSWGHRIFLLKGDEFVTWDHVMFIRCGITDANFVNGSKWNGYIAIILDGLKFVKSSQFEYNLKFYLKTSTP